MTYICPMHKARVLANAYYWNNLYRKRGDTARYRLDIPDAWALEIIPYAESCQCSNQSPRRAEYGIYRGRTLRRIESACQAECLRRCHTGSVAEYGGEKYEYTNSPTEDHTVDVEHYEKLALPLSKIHSEKVPSLDGRRIVFDEDITEFEAALTLFETRPMTDKTRGDCETSCTGACYTGCSGDCTGGCETTCSGECQDLVPAAGAAARTPAKVPALAAVTAVAATAQAAVPVPATVAALAAPVPALAAVPAVVPVAANRPAQ